MNDAAVALAYKQCERITRSRARNFYYGIRLLPPRQRSAMCALYAMARRIDDVGDSLASAPSDGRLTALREVQVSLELLAKATNDGAPGRAAPPGDPVLIALADTLRQFPLPMGAFMDLVEGCEWDIAGRRYQTFAELTEYCHRVAGSIGRLSVAIYGPTDSEAAGPLADALGVGLQLTNILRDLVEDRDVMGRVYLPAEDLARFGVGADLGGQPDDLMALICFETGRAVEWYEQGLALLPLLDRRSRACTAAMAGIYRRLLDKIRVAPGAVLAQRIGLSPAEKVTVAARALATGAA